MSTNPASRVGAPDEDVPSGKGRQPAGEELRARLARHGFLVSDDVDDPQGADALASTMLSVIQSMLATDPANAPPAVAADGEDTAGPSPSKPSTSS